MNKKQKLYQYLITWLLAFIPAYIIILLDIFGNWR